MALTHPRDGRRARVGLRPILVLLAATLLSSGCAILDGLTTAARPPPGGTTGREEAESPASGLGPPGPGRPPLWPPIFTTGIMSPTRGPTMGDGSYGMGAGSVGGGERCFRLAGEGLPARDLAQK